MSVFEGLEPKRVYDYLEQFLSIPRETYNTKAASDYCVAFAKEHGLWVKQDEANNVIIKKPGTPGYEKSEAVILQGHLDMVCAKDPDLDFDFAKDAIQAYVEDGYVKAKGTTLGADNGIALGIILAILESDDIPHPPIEALFTSDEEDGLLGAEALDMSDFTATKLLNVDGEVEGVLTIGCAGGIRMAVHIPIEKETAEGTAIEIRIRGLLGGHSGAEIHHQRGNAHKMLGRLLNRIRQRVDMRLVFMEGGKQDNVISSDSTARILVKESDAELVKELVLEMEQTFLDEFMGEEPGLKVVMKEEPSVKEEVLGQDSTDRAIDFLVILPNGVMEYSRKLEGIVETSLNVGAVHTTDTHFTTVHYLRSSVDTRNDQLWEKMNVCAKMVGGEVELLTKFLAWPMRLGTKLQDIMSETYQEMFGKDVVIDNLHAGLEPARFVLKKPELECVSFGPNLEEVHSVNERMDIASVTRTWNYILEILKKCK